MLFALTLLGCSAWIDQEPACEQDVYYWSDDLLAYVLTGDGSGEFAFDPEDEPRSNIEGSYDPKDGDFSWVEEYEPAFYLEEAEVEGFGTVYHNGNLDLYFERTVTDMLDVVTATAYRVQRSGCNMTVATWDPEGSVDNALVMEGSYSDESVWEWEADVSGYSVRGSLRKNLLRTQQIEADDGSAWSFVSAKPDGETEEEWTGSCGEYYCEGTTTRHFDGTLSQAYELFDGSDSVATVTGEFEYDDSGTLTVEQVGGPTCDYTYDADGDCSYECDDGQDGSC